MKQMKKYLWGMVAVVGLLFLWPLGAGAEEIDLAEKMTKFMNDTGFAKITGENWLCVIMILLSCVLMYLAIVKKFEPLLLLPIAFGMLLSNLPGAGMFHAEFFEGGQVHWESFRNASNAGILDYLYLGVKAGLYPCIIFIGVGAMTDFGPLLANPKSFLLGAAAQIGIFVTFLGALGLGFTFPQASSIGIIGGADGPTAIHLTSKLAPELLVVHGAGTGNSTAHHAGSDDEEGTGNRDEAIADRVKNGKDYLPHRGNDFRVVAVTVGGIADWLPDAG